jgi:dipeptidase E
MKIVAIGGGEMGEGATLPIDKHIVELTGASWPNALFIPTASSDSADYAAIFTRIYGDTLGCNVNVLSLLNDPPSAERIAEMIFGADLIYVGGGNTLKLMKRWRKLGVDKLLIEAAARNKVLCGLSAGELCWFAYGHSDSMSFYHPDDWDYIRVKCLGLLPFTACPHYDGENRHANFQKLIAREGGIGIALDDCAALEVIDDQYRIITSRAGAGAYRVERVGGIAVQTAIPIQDAFQPLGTLQIPVHRS